MSIRDVFQNMKSFLETQNLLVYIILYAPCKHENNLGLEPHMKNLFFWVKYSLNVLNEHVGFDCFSRDHLNYK